jgi:ATP-dependent RNA helicase DeaD
VAITLAEPREHRMLKAIERTTKQRIAVEKVPTVADLHARQLEMTRAALHESLLEDELDRFRVVVETLADEFDVMEVALAAVKLAHEATATGGADDDEEIPQVPPPKAERGSQGGRGGSGPKRRGPGGGPAGADGAMTRLFVGAGRAAGVRPQDLVGAITGESSLSGRQIGAIEISDRFSLVEVPEVMAEDVIQALRGTKIRGKKATVRRERY